MSILPGWNSLVSVTWWSHFYEIAGIVALAFLVVFEVLAFRYGRQREALTELAEQERAAPRALTEVQKAAISDALAGKPHGTVEIRSDAGVPDASPYAHMIAPVLRANGWTVQTVNWVGNSRQGVWLIVRDQQNVPAEVLRQALATAGIKVSVFLHDQFGPDQIALTIGPK